MSVGVLLIAYVGVLVGYQSYQQHRLESAWASAHPAGSIHDATTTAASGTGTAAFAQLQPHLADGQPLARLNIPRIGFESIVTEGSDTGILSGGPGHDNHTGYPGEGRIILIGNHNGFSLSWGDLHTGDTIQLEMGYGRYSYTISTREIVDGNDQKVVRDPVPGEHLYLTTCWPLWQGALAGQRLVFIADPSGSKA